MENSAMDSVLLPLNFPQSFLPDRRLLAQLLTFAAANGEGDKEAISAQTGIPTGKSTGKVEPMIYYAHGMGLITAKKAASHWQLGLTPLGQIIFQEDSFLSEPQTLWLLHLMLSRRYTLSSPATGVADAWFTVFAESDFRLGKRFTHARFLAFLIERHGDKGYLKSLSSLVLRSYLAESCFGQIAVLQQSTDDFFIRQSAPLEKSFFPVYAAYFYLLWDELFNTDNQIALDLFSKQSRCFSIMGWNETMIATWLDWMNDKGLIQIDRYTGSPVLLRLQKTNQVLTAIYSELI